MTNFTNFARLFRWPWHIWLTRWNIFFLFFLWSKREQRKLQRWKETNIINSDWKNGKNSNEITASAAPTACRRDRPMFKHFDVFTVAPANVAFLHWLTLLFLEKLMKITTTRDRERERGRINLNWISNSAVSLL